MHSVADMTFGMQATYVMPGTVIVVPASIHAVIGAVKSLCCQLDAWLFFRTAGLSRDIWCCQCCAFACRHTTRFILIYIFFMPLVLWKYLEWGVYFVAPMITLLLAGIDNIGVHIENPILILPMSAYCHVIHDNLIVAASDWSLNNSQASSGHFACSVVFKHNCMTINMHMF
jgi:hypothetical protein